MRGHGGPAGRVTEEPATGPAVAEETELAVAEAAVRAAAVGVAAVWVAD